MGDRRTAEAEAAAAAAARLRAYGRAVRALREAEGAPLAPAATLSAAQRDALFAPRVAQVLLDRPR